MKIPINLASRPFRRDRAMVAASAAVSVLLVATLGLLVYLTLLDRSQLADLRGDIARLNRSVAAATRQQNEMNAILRKPENAVVLERSVFINNLLVHKAVSWSRLFTDLEKTIPFNVKVLALHPSVNGQSQVSLDIMAGAESPEALIAFLRALEQSPMFGGVTEQNTTPPTQSEPLYRCRVLVNYAQKL